MQEEEKIVVFRIFDSPVEANLAKTKLDAYGIPCFLTEENLANLYPIHNPRVSGVRLHLFMRDAEQARQLLNEVVPQTDEDTRRCPRCLSARIEFDYTKKISSRIVSILMSLFVLLFPPRKVYHCLDCEHEFKG